MDSTLLARLVAAGRIGFGVALLIRPERTTTLWLGADSARAGTQVTARGLGARDIALGAGALAADPAALRNWVAGAVAADLSDFAATLLAGSAIPSKGRIAVGVLALGGAGLGAAALAGLSKN